MLQFCCKYTSLSVGQKLLKYNAVGQIYCKKIKRCIFFAPQCSLAIFRRGLHNRASNAGRVGTNRDPGRIDGYRTMTAGASAIVEFYLYPTVGTVLIHSVKPELTE